MTEIEKLTKIIEQLEKRVTNLEGEVNKLRSPWTMPHYPPTTIPPLTLAVSKCHKCGIDVANTMGYVCSNKDCPCGFGSST